MILYGHYTGNVCIGDYLLIKSLCEATLHVHGLHTVCVKFEGVVAGRYLLPAYITQNCMHDGH